MDRISTKIPGCELLRLDRKVDARGDFLKIFQKSSFQPLGLDFSPKEIYFSTSHQNVIRGLHFQTPPNEYQKCVTVMHGEVFDVVLDLRKGSPTYGQHQSFHLKAMQPELLWIPKGLAHGFCALSESATLAYMVDQEYAPQSDAGIRWDSTGIQWPTQRPTRNPILSARDAALPCLKDFNSPFTF